MKSTADRPHLVLVPVQDMESMLGVPSEGGIGRGPPVAAGPASSPPPDPEVRVDVQDDHLVVRFVGDPRPRRVSALTLGRTGYIEGEEDGPVIRRAEPMGSDAVAVFDLSAHLPRFPIVSVDWEQPVIPGLLGPIGLEDETPVNWFPEEYVPAEDLIARKVCGQPTAAAGTEGGA